MTIRSALAAAATLGLLCGAAAAQTPAPDAPRREIVVTGSGEARARPDMASASFAVLRTARTAREALDAANGAMASVIEGMKGLGIEPRDIQTSGFGITPQYRYDNNPNGEQKPPELVGYEARNALTIRVRDLAKVGEILDRAVTLGINSGGDISFGIDDPAKLRIEARQDALRDATASARALAQAADVPLGEIVRIDTRDEAMAPVPQMQMRMAMDAAAPKASVPVEAGETSVAASVTVTFALGR